MLMARPPPPPRRLAVVPDLTCEKCMELARELASKDDVIRRFAEDNSALGEQISGYISSERRWARTVAGLEAKLRQHSEDSPNAKLIRRVLNAWLEPRKGRPNTDTGGDRWQVVARALKLGHTDPMIPCPVHDESGGKRPKAEVPADAVCTTVLELEEAILGLYLKPFMKDAQRVSVNMPGSQRYDDIDHALGSAKRIEAMRATARRARMSLAEKRKVAWELADGCAQWWFGLLMEAITARPPDDDEEEKP